MAIRKNNRFRPRWPIAALGLALGAVIGAVAILTPAMAVHDVPYSNFEIDGNPTDPNFPVGGALNLPDDWDSIFQLPYTGTAAQPVYPSPRGNPTPGDQETFVFDDGTQNQVDYGFSGQSNKDIQDVDEWLYDDAKLTPDKDNITHAYAKAYHVDVNSGAAVEDHLVINFGADRFSNNGDAALGFWFFQDLVGRDTANRRGVGPFKGEHVDGDILVQVDFIQGGTKANKIQIFEWQGDGLGSHGTLNQIAYEEGTGNTVCTDNDDACAQTNSVAWPSPWAYAPKAGPSGIFGVQSFFEGGIDITALIGHELCFTTFMAETRTSHSETAELKDFAVGAFELCSVDLVRKSCVANGTVSPAYLAATNTFQTEHVIQVRNDGFGAIFDLAIQDNAVTTTNPASSTGSSCKITAITGGVNPVTVPTAGIPMPVPVLNNTDPADDGWISVAGALSNIAGQDTMSVTLRCISPTNPFVNSATVRAAALTGLEPTLSDFYAEQDTAGPNGQPPSDVRPQCVKNIPTGLTLTKACPDPVVFELIGGVYKPKVCVDITLKNDGESVLDVFLFDDVRKDSTVSLLSNLTLGSDNKRELQPGETVSVEDCYNPVTPDGTPPILDPDLVTYSDTVKAYGFPHHAPSTQVTATDKSVSCPLCPIGLNN